MLRCSILYTWHFATIHAEEVAQARFIHVIILHSVDFWASESSNLFGSQGSYYDKVSLRTQMTSFESKSTRNSYIGGLSITRYF